MKTIARSSALAALALLAAVSVAQAAAKPRPSRPSWHGKVVHVSDGDTIVVEHRGKKERIRLYGVDAPESSQRFGQDAKELTTKLVLDKEVTIEPVVRDPYGRTVGVVKLADGHTLEENLVENGLAWLYEHFADAQAHADWGPLEKAARDAKKGLWADDHPTPPWEYRKHEKHH